MIEKIHKTSKGMIHYWFCGAEGTAAADETISAGEDTSVKRDSVCLVFLHGLTANHSLFQQQISHFCGKYSIFVWDAPGHGRSRPYEGFSYKDMAEALDEILSIEGVKKPILIGQSMGGFVAQTYLRRYPGKAAGFIGIGTCPLSPGYYSRMDLWWLRQIKWMAGLFSDQQLRKAMAKQCGFKPVTREHMLRMTREYTKKELCGLMHLGFSRLIPELRELDPGCPIELIIGKQDRTGRIQKYNRMWSEKEGYPLHRIQAAAHNANEDQPEEVNRVIEDFLFKRFDI